MSEHHDPAKQAPQIQQPRESNPQEFTPFPFLSLPFEIRLEIYRLCLTNKSPLFIISSIPKPDNSRPVQWSGRSEDDGIQNVNLLRINKNIYREALPVLYSLNTFHFNRWVQFCDFTDHINRSSIPLIRKVEIAFPLIGRDCDAEVPTSYFQERALQKSLAILKSFDGLQSLRLILRQDLMTCDIELLRTINRAGCNKGCRIELRVEKARIYIIDSSRPRLIYFAVASEMQSWGWKISGDWELVDKHHRFWDERQWVEWLRQGEKAS